MMLPPYQPEPLTNFALPENEAAFRAALEQVHAQLGQTYPLVIGGQRLPVGETFASDEPRKPGTGGCRFAQASPTQAAQAIEAARAI
ncbi:MAG: hypothetical protein HC915_04885 [Anaerolineae bacterium]|nr:hypothetical protein [Anaerolineae bacterium]